MDRNNVIVGDHLLYSYFVKYDRLITLINGEFYNSNYDKINIFIDAYSMIKTIYKLDPSQFIDRYSIASCIINACAHYRNFFWTRYKVTCKIWIVFSRMEQSIIEARAFYPGYTNVFIEENNLAMDAMIEENLKILETLCPYIPDVQFIHSKYEPGLVFGLISSSIYGLHTPSFIISKDIWPLQTVANCKNVYMIRPVKKNGVDESILISDKNVLLYYYYIRKIGVTKEISNIGYEYLSFIIASTRFPERGMKSLHNMNTILNAISKGLSKNLIPSGKMVSDIEGLCNTLNFITRGIRLKEYDISLRMNAIGYYTCICRYMMSPMQDNIEIINLHDPDSVKRINETYFSKVPLDLMSL